MYNYTNGYIHLYRFISKTFMMEDIPMTMDFIIFLKANKDHVDMLSTNTKQMLKRAVIEYCNERNLQFKDI